MSPAAFERKRLTLRQSTVNGSDPPHFTGQLASGAFQPRQAALDVNCD